MNPQDYLGKTIRINDRRGHGHQSAAIEGKRIIEMQPWNDPRAMMIGGPSFNPYSQGPSDIQWKIRFETGDEYAYYLDEIEIVVVSAKPGRATVDVSLDSVVMSPKKKDEIRAAISQVKNEDLIFTKWGFGKIFEKGTAISLLFWGIPGTGKTLTAQAIADEMKAELKVYGVAEIQSSEPGQAEREIQTIFAAANKQNRSKAGKHHIILFDECDSLLMDRNEVGPILGAMVNQLLTEIERYEGVIIFTTNRMGKLDPALERRISAKIEFEFPDRAARLSIWERMIPKEAPLAKSVNLKKLSEYPLAGGNIKNAVLNAARHAAYEGKKQIEQSDFVDAIEREAAALSSFIAEYEEQTHTRMLSGPQITEGRGLSIKDGMKMEIKRKRGGFEERGDNE